MKQDILVFGGSGFIGSSLVSKIKKFKNFKVFSTSYTKKKDNLSIDLAYKTTLKKLPKKINTIVHLAGNPKTFLKSKKGKKQYLLNTSITKNLANYANISMCKKFIFISSVYVYSGNNTGIFREDLNTKPKDYLGKSKKKSEEILKKIFKKNKHISCIILRLFTVYGPNQRSDQFLSVVKKKINSTSKVIKLRDGRAFRDYIFIDDVINLIIKIIKKNEDNKYDIFNVASGTSYSVRQLVNIFLKVAKKNKKIVFTNEKNSFLKNDNNHFANIQKIKKKYGWKPKINISRGLKLIYEKKS